MAFVATMVTRTATGPYRSATRRQQRSSAKESTATKTGSRSCPIGRTPVSADRLVRKHKNEPSAYRGRTDHDRLQSEWDSRGGALLRSGPIPMGTTCIYGKASCKTLSNKPTRTSPWQEGRETEPVDCWDPVRADGTLIDRAADLLLTINWTRGTASSKRYRAEQEGSIGDSSNRIGRRDRSMIGVDNR
jgi:hypothetical protein